MFLLSLPMALCYRSDGWRVETEVNSYRIRIPMKTHRYLLLPGIQDTYRENSYVQFRQEEGNWEEGHFCIGGNLCISYSQSLNSVLTPDPCTWCVP